MRYAALKAVDIADGPGVRVGLYVSGCNRHCPGCHNAEAWPFDAGQAFDRKARKMLFDALRPDWIQGISVLGGEPFEPRNVRCVKQLIGSIRRYMPEKDVWIYTGYTIEQLIDRIGAVGRETMRLLRMTDVLVDGPFVMDERDLSLRFRGSRNQRIIDIQKTMDFGEVVLWDGKSKGWQ